MSITSGNYYVDMNQLIPYLVLTILSIVVSLSVFFYFMDCSDISKHDREQFNSKVYNYIVEADGQS